MPENVTDYLLGQIAANTAGELGFSKDLAAALVKLGGAGSGAGHPINSPTTSGFKAQALQASGVGPTASKALSGSLLANVRQLIYPGGASIGGNQAQANAGALAGARLQAQGGPGVAALTSLAGLAGAGAVGAVGFAAIKLAQNEVFPGDAQVTSNKGSLDSMVAQSGDYQSSIYGRVRDTVTREIPNAVENIASAVAGWFGSAVHNGPR